MWGAGLERKAFNYYKLYFTQIWRGFAFSSGTAVGRRTYKESCSFLVLAICRHQSSQFLASFLCWIWQLELSFSIRGVWVRSLVGLETCPLAADSWSSWTFQSLLLAIILNSTERHSCSLGDRARMPASYSKSYCDISVQRLATRGQLWFSFRCYIPKVRDFTASRACPYGFLSRCYR